MSRRRQTTIQLVVSTFICGLIVWHVVYWHSTGIYLEMFKWLQAGKGYITVLYNLGLMLALGITLGFLMERIGELLGYGKNANKK